MLFSKAIQIKLLVNKFNQLRKRTDFSHIEFKAEMYRDGKWAVTLTAMGNGMFYSIEMDELIAMFAGGRFSIRVACINGLPYIDIQ